MFFAPKNYYKIPRIISRVLKSKKKSGLSTLSNRMLEILVLGRSESLFPENRKISALLLAKNTQI